MTVLSWKTGALTHRRGPEGFRVLIAAPYGRDADNVAHLLDERGFQTQVLPDARAVATQLDDETGVVLILSLIHI